MCSQVSAVQQYAFQMMECSGIIVCRYDGETVVRRIAENSSFNDLKDFILGRWPSIMRDDMAISYKIIGQPKCMVSSETDYVNMIDLIKMMGLNRVDLCVVDMGMETDSSSDEGESTPVSVQDTSLVKYTDMQPNFVGTRQRVLQSASWVGEIRDVGQKFEGGVEEFRRALCKYAIQSGFNFKYLKNETKRVTAECSLHKEKGCKWRIHASMLNLNGFFYIRSFEKMHTCGSVIRSSKHSRVNSQLVGDLMEETIRWKPLYRPIDVIGKVKRSYGLDIKYHHAWLGVENARRGVYGDAANSFDKLRFYFDEAQRVNPGSHLVLDVDHTSKRFRRCFVSFAACIQGFRFLRPLIFLDGTFLKGRHRGVVLGATCKTGNQEVYHLAFAVVGAEDKDNWLWFLTELRSILEFDRKITFISDRHIGIVEGIKSVFPDCFHSFCMFHMKYNLIDKLKGVHPSFRSRLVYKFNQCAYAADYEQCYARLEELFKEGGNRVKDFVDDIPLQHWCNAFFMGQRYGEMSSSVAESWNRMIDEARHMPITSMVDSIRVQAMEGLAGKRNQCKDWNGVICPVMHDRLQEALDKGTTWTISSAHENLYEVHSDPSVYVDTNLRQCSCGMWQHQGFPCPHAAAVLHSSSHLTGKDIMEFIDPYYYVSYYRKAVATAIHPVTTFGRADNGVAEREIWPPITRKLPGRPKNKRIPSRGEKVRMLRCSRCGKKARHNRKSCREIIRD